MNTRQKTDSAWATIIFLAFVALVVWAGTHYGWESPTQAQDHEAAIKKDSITQLAKQRQETLSEI